MIPMVDLKQQYLSLKKEIDDGVLQVLRDTRFILGPNVVAFEKEAAAYLGVEHAVTCASGTDALHLSLRAVGVEPGDEVVTSAFTFIATAEAIRYTGAKPVFVDVDPQTFNFDPAAVERAISSKTRAVVPVYLFGMPAEMTRLMPLCESRNIKVIEDCAQSFGAHVGGRKTGSFGACGAFSFFPSKNLGAYGDGGMITTRSEVIAAKLRVLRNHGMQSRYRHNVIGYNSRLDELQAVVLRAKLKRIDHFNEQRRRVAHTYSKLLRDVELQLPCEISGFHHVYHQYTVLSPRRDRIAEKLRTAGIASAIYYPIPLHRQSAFAGEFSALELPVAERIATECLSLPMYPELSDDAIHRIVGVIKEALVA